MIINGKRENRSPFLERRWHNMSKGMIISIVIAFALPIPLIISLLSMEQYVSVGVFAAIWIFLIALLFFFNRRSRLNAYHIVDETIVEKTIIDLESDRINERQKFTTTEILELRQGKKIPVLDVWRSDPQLTVKHGFFSRIVQVTIDPQRKEMAILIQLPTLHLPAPDEANNFNRQFIQRIGEFLKVAAGEPRITPFKDFIETLIIECDSLREDGKGYDIPFPVFSVELSSKQFWKLSSLFPHQDVLLETIADLRFSNGSEIQPHRTMRSL